MSTPKKPAVVDPDMAPAALLTYFEAVRDPRIERSRLHPLSSILVMSLCAIICGAESFVGIEEWAKAKRSWLESFLELPNGIPSHDTIGRVLAALDPRALAKAFREWVEAVARVTHGEVVAIDGKTLRRSFRQAGDGVFVHMVSAWATHNRVVLGQVRTEEKSNEITAIPRLLELLQLKGCLVTIDAMGCQKDIAKRIVDGGADFFLAVKDNQPLLREALEDTFVAAGNNPEWKSKVDFDQTENKGHGRIELRRCWTTDRIEPLPGFQGWPEVKTLARIEVDRTIKGKTSTEQRYYICSRRELPAAEALGASRSHWGIENSLHWVLDVAFNEDQCRVRVGHAAENFAVLRHLAINLLRSAPGKKLGAKTRRLIAASNESFLEQVLAGAPVGG